MKMKTVFRFGVVGVLALAGCMSGMYSSEVSVDKKAGGISDYTIVKSLNVVEYPQSMPVVVESRSMKKKEDNGLNNLLWFFTLGIVPGFSSETMIYDVKVKTPIGERSGTCKLEASSWMGWLPIFIPYPGDAEERTPCPRLPNATLERKVQDKLVANLVSQFSRTEYAGFVTKNNTPELKAQRAKEVERERLNNERLYEEAVEREELIMKRARVRRPGETEEEWRKRYAKESIESDRREDLARQQEQAGRRGQIARYEAFSFVRSFDKSLDLEHRQLKGLFGRKFGEIESHQHDVFKPENRFLFFDEYYTEAETPLDRDQYIIYRVGAKNTGKNNETEASRLFDDTVRMIEEKFGRKIELHKIEGIEFGKKGELLFDSGKTRIFVSLRTERVERGSAMPTKEDLENRIKFILKRNLKYKDLDDIGNLNDLMNELAPSDRKEVDRLMAAMEVVERMNVPSSYIENVVEVYAESIEIREAIMKKKKELSVKAEEDKRRAEEKARRDYLKASQNAL